MRRGYESVLETVKVNDESRFTPTTYLEIGFMLKPLSKNSFFTGEIKIRGHEYYPTGSSTEISIGIGTDI